MIIGIGIDLIEIERIKKACEENPRFLERIFTERERDYCFKFKEPYEHLAVRFAGKEATFKALGHRIGWKDVEIINEISGKPKLLIKNLEKGILPRISLSHNRTIASAVVILEREEKF